MAGIRGKNTKPEMIARSHLHRAGLRFRLHARLPGRPDIVLPRYRTVVFVHGCYWHRHKGCRYAAVPASNRAFWQRKFEQNVQRDALVVKQLRRLGWKVRVIWECQLSERRLDALVARIKGNVKDE